MRAALLTSLVLLGSLLSAGRAQAEPEGWIFGADDENPWELAFMGQFHTGPYAGGSVLLGIPVAKYGFSRSINDGFYIDIHIGAGGWPPIGSRLGFGALRPMVGVRYQLRLYDYLALYFAARGGPYLIFSTRGVSVLGSGEGMFGMVFSITDVFGLRIEGGFPGLNFGVNFRL